MKLTDDLNVRPQDAFTGAFITLFFSVSRFIDASDDYLNGQKVHLSSLVFGAMLLSATIYLFLRGTQMRRKAFRQNDQDTNTTEDAA
jgi:hypothetical protein